MKSASMIVLLSSLLCCSQKEISSSDLYLLNGTYLYKGSPYTGRVYYKYPSGRISGYVTLRHGIPNGKWQTFGYSNEVIQEGEYMPVSNHTLSYDSCFRFTIARTVEGDEIMYDAFIVRHGGPCHKVIDTMIIKQTLNKEYRIKLERVYIVNGEL